MKGRDKIMKQIKLNDGHAMPILGFGVYQIPLEETKAAVLEALKDGYRSLDTAQYYGNEAAVGEAIKESGLKREELFLTTKIWVGNFGYEKAKTSIEESLKRLQTDYIDLMLLHQPYNDIYGAWKALIEAQRAGKVRSIGVSNFSPYRVRDLELYSGVKPAINQIELHPFHQRVEEVKFYQEDNIQVESWASFAEGKNGIFTNSTIKAIGEHYHKSNAQVILRWLIQKDIVVIPKSVTPSRIKENIDVFDFELSATEIKTLDQLDEKKSLFINHESPAGVEQIFSLVK